MFKTVAKFFLKCLIRGYQLLLSPIFGQRCKFHPSCSHYAMEAVEKHGTVKGSWLAVKRLAKCHPFSGKSGVDLVP